MMRWYRDWRERVRRRRYEERLADINRASGLERIILEKQEELRAFYEDKPEPRPESVHDPNEPEEVRRSRENYQRSRSHRETVEERAKRLANEHAARTMLASSSAAAAVAAVSVLAAAAATEDDDDGNAEGGAGEPEQHTEPGS